MTADHIREALVATGTAQLGDTSLHIGPRPNLQGAISNLSGPPALYTTPYYVDTVLNEGEMATIPMWLHNRSSTGNVYFYIYDRDTTTGKAIGNWLEVSKQTGYIQPLDSTEIDIYVDASLIEQRVADYKGMLEILWGHSATTYDSVSYVPVYLQIPCDNSFYITKSSDDIDGPEYNWISAKDLGSKIDNSSFYGIGNVLDDGSTGPVALGFNFPFYQNVYDLIYIGANGAISFTDVDVNVDGYYSGLSIPGTPFGTFIAPFWADMVIDEALTPEAGVYFYGSPTLDTAVIQWYHMANFNSFGDTLTNFEIVLTTDGNILFQYNSVGTSGLEEIVLVGIAELECKALEYVNNGNIPEHVVGDNKAVLFKINQSWTRSGNVDAIGDIDISDLVYLVTYMFDSGPDPIPYESGDVNCTGDIDISDLVYLVEYMFGTGGEPCYFWMNIE